MNGTAQVKYHYQLTEVLVPSDTSTKALNDRRAAIEEFEQAMRYHSVTSEITSFEFESDYLKEIDIEIGLFEIDSLGKYLHEKNDIGVKFSYSPKKFIITFSEFFPVNLLLIFAQIKQGDIKLELSFDRPIKKLKTKNRFTRQDGQKIILNPTIAHSGIKGKENQIVILFN